MAVAACALGLLAPTAAPAEVALALSGTDNFAFSAAQVDVPFNPGAVTALSFSFPDGKKKVRLITFSAECAVVAPNGDYQSFLDIDIVVDGVVVTPTTGAFDAFCSANGTATTDGWATHSITVAKMLKPGTHTLVIKARRNYMATSGWLGERSVIVHD